MLFSELVNIDQQKKVIINFCYVSENTIFSNLNFTAISYYFFLSILDHFQTINDGFEPLRSGGRLPRP